MTSERPQRAHTSSKSPITPELLARTRRIEDLAWSRDGRELVWLEQTKGRGTLYSLTVDSGEKRALTQEHDVRGRVGNGGGAFTLGDDVVVFTADGVLHRVALSGGASEAITPPFGEAAAPAISHDGSLVLYVHHHAGEDSLALVSAHGERWPQRLVRGADFYMQPTWHPDGRQIAWIEWDHPCMPWDGTRLCLATLEFVEGVCVGRRQRVVAGDEDTAVSQPRFSADGRWLAFCSDRSGYGEIYLHDLSHGTTRQLSRRGADLDIPAWTQGLRTYCFSDDGRRLWAVDHGCPQSGGARHRLLELTLDGETRELARLAAYESLAQPAARPRYGGLALLGSSPLLPPRILLWEDDEAPQRLHQVDDELDAALLTDPEDRYWTASDGQQVHALFYAPKFYAPKKTAARGSDLPPALVLVHGGPTGQQGRAYDLRMAFFTSRGIAVLVVNYRGSSGYGRAYRRSLAERWGVSDLEDALAAHRHLVETGSADPERIGIIGASAGGYTVLRALTARPETFAVGVSLYGISDLFSLAADTHKFEARYCDSLLGPLPQQAERYRERSPLFAAERITAPLALFQGAEDQVVPKSQAQAFAGSLQQRGIAHELHIYEGEGHGWRQPATIRRHYEALESFLERHL